MKRWPSVSSRSSARTMSGGGIADIDNGQAQAGQHRIAAAQNPAHQLH